MFEIIDDIWQEFGQQRTQDLFLIHLGEVNIKQLSSDHPTSYLQEWWFPLYSC